MWSLLICVLSFPCSGARGLADLVGLPLPGLADSQREQTTPQGDHLSHTNRPRACTPNALFALGANIALSRSPQGQGPDSEGPPRHPGVHDSNSPIPSPFFPMKTTTQAVDPTFPSVPLPPTDPGASPVALQGMACPLFLESVS